MSDLERIVTEIPGPRSRALADRLRAAEARGVTYLASNFPTFWSHASGATVTDVDGNRYLDLTSAFGVASTGHANAAVARAIAEQAARLPHGMGDVHPTIVKTELLERLAALAPLERPSTYLCSSGAEAVEFALKTALLWTGKPNALAFRGAYHGLSHGALEVSGIAKFRIPFATQLRDVTSFVDFPSAAEASSAARTLAQIVEALDRDPQIGALVVEPIQGRGGVVVPPDGFLTALRTLTKERRIALIVDEIFTGFGRTGTRFAIDRERVRPDLLCVGKALGGGFPIAATIGCGSAMDAWAPSSGEALHTSTYLGNPMACAAALANLTEMESLDVVARAGALGKSIEPRLRALSAVHPIRAVRGRGALWGVELIDPAVAQRTVIAALERGLVLLPCGAQGETLTIAPPLTIEGVQLDRALELLDLALGAAVRA